MTDAVRTETNGHVFEVTLDNPKANAIGGRVSRALNDAFIRFRDDPDLWVAIFTGAGERFFSTGWDLAEAATGEPDTDYGPGGFGGLMELELDKPVIGAINGYCVAGGFELALCCDLLVAADHAQFFLSEVNVGLTPAAASVTRLTTRVPYSIAADMLLTGRRMDAAEAERVNLVTKSVPPAELMDEARALADRLVAAAPLSVRAVKQMIRVTQGMSPEEALAADRAGRLPLKTTANSSEDSEEGPRAFAEKRAPVWKGR